MKSMYISFIISVQILQNLSESIHYFRETQSPTLYHVAIKAGLYRKAVQV